MVIRGGEGEVHTFKVLIFARGEVTTYIDQFSVR